MPARLPAMFAAALCSAALLAAALTVGASASGAEAATQSVSGSGLAGLGSGVNAFDVSFHASKTADGTVSGQFTGSGRLTGLGVDIPLPVTLAGPVTCLTVRGNTASFLYPLSGVKPALLQPVLGATSIQITVVAASAGKPAKIGFLGPLPTALAKSCNPSLAPFTLTGTATVSA